MSSEARAYLAGSGGSVVGYVVVPGDVTVAVVPTVHVPEDPLEVEVIVELATLTELTVSLCPPDPVMTDPGVTYDSHPVELFTVRVTTVEAFVAKKP